MQKNGNKLFPFFCIENISHRRMCNQNLVKNVIRDGLGINENISFFWIFWYLWYLLVF